MATRDYEFFRKVIEGTVSGADLLELVAEKVTEGHFHDYKSGKISARPKDAARTVREYFTGFANARGGVLILGVDGKTWTIDGFVAPGGTDPREWASTCLTELVAKLSVPPEVRTIDVNGSTVLLVATERAPSLIPLREGPDEVYHFRNFHQTIKAHPSLINDLLLGRRQEPNLALRLLRVRPRQPDGDEKWGSAVPIDIQCAVENVGLQWIDDFRVALVSWTLGAQPVHSEPALAQVEAVAAEHQGLAIRFLLNHAGGTHSLVPFQQSRTFELGPIRLPFFLPEMTVQCALCILPRGSAPIWHELSYRWQKDDFRVNERLVMEKVSFTPVLGRRPKVFVKLGP